MYAIVDIAGQQFKVQKDQQIFVHRLENAEGEKVAFDKVLLVDNDGKVEIGAPVIKGMAVEAKVIRHLQGDKVQVFKKKRRKGYQKSNGHRQQLSEIAIEAIGKASSTAAKAKPAAEPKEEKAATAKKAAPKKTAETKEAPKAAVKKETKTEEKSSSNE